MIAVTIARVLQQGIVSRLPWLLLAAGLLFLVLFLYWLLVTTEGVFLGRRIVVLLYDLTAHKYDAIKEYRPEDERLLVVRPVLQATSTVSRPRILDVATGTGRVPFDLMQEAAFTGHITGLDDSKRMLEIARSKLAPYGEQVALMRHPAVPLPFADSSFDLVTCLEALEFFPSDAAALREMVRVLRPGGWLLTTRRCGPEGHWFLHRYRSEENMTELLQDLGLEAIRLTPWEINYNLVRARKPAT